MYILYPKPKTKSESDMEREMFSEREEKELQKTLVQM